MANRVIIIAGWPGSGKSFLANKISTLLNTVHIDKDVYTHKMTEQMLTILGKDITDRESSTYLSTVRPIEYEQLYTIARHLIKNNAGDIIISAPFFNELVDQDNPIHEVLSYEDTKIVKIWIDCPASDQRHRLIERGAHRDKGKLSNWEEYSKVSCQSPPPDRYTKHINNAIENESNSLAELLCFLEAHQPPTNFSDDDVRKIYGLSGIPQRHI